MPLLELALRVATFTQLGVITLVLLWHQSDHRSYRSVAVLFAGIGCYLIAPLAIRDWQWSALAYPVLLMATLVPVFFWYFCCTVFDDEFSPAPAVKGLVLASCILGFLGICNEAGCALSDHAWIAQWGSHMMKFLWTAAAFALVVRDWGSDLVEPRRRLRRVILFGGGCYLLSVLVVELLIEGQAPAALELFNVSLLLLGVTSLSIYLLAPSGNNVFARVAAPLASAQQTRSPIANRIVAAMETERVYAEEGLTIDALGRRLDLPSHQLRRIINGELGYRNFNAFINGYRVREVAAKLGEPEFANTPFLTLALDAGFRSIAPFNRSFRDEFGLTPTAYRQQPLKNNINFQ
ncbi:MAG: AraC family transcriptional regulator [Pseudomonadota bacterium]